MYISHLVPGRPSLNVLFSFLRFFFRFQLRRGRARGTAPVRVRTPTTRPSTAPPSPLSSRPRRPALSALHLPPSWCLSGSSNNQALRVKLRAPHTVLQAAPEVLTPLMKWVLMTMFFFGGGGVLRLRGLIMFISLRENRCKFILRKFN